MFNSKQLIFTFATLAVCALTALGFQNCGKNTDLSQYGNNQSSSSTGGPGGGTPPVTAPAVSAFSNNAALTVGQALGLYATFSGSGTIVYSWTKNGVATANNTNSYNVAAVTAADQGTYILTAANSAGSAAVTFTVTVAPPPPLPPTVTKPVITTAPQNISTDAFPTSNLSISVVASGTALTYQWYFTKVNTTTEVALVGATSSVYTFPDTVLNSGVYRVVVSNSAGSAMASCTVDIQRNPGGNK